MLTKNALLPFFGAFALGLSVCASAQPSGVSAQIIYPGGNSGQVFDPFNVDLAYAVDPGYVEGHVNLPSGQFHGAARISHTDPTSSAATSYILTMNDTLTLVGTGSAPVPLTVTYRAHGTFFWDNLLGDTQEERLTTTSLLTFGNGSAEFSSQLQRVGTPTGVSETFHQDVFGDVIQTQVSKPEIDITVEVTQNMTPGQSFSFQATLEGQAQSTFGPGCGQDYLHTGQMGVILPPGYSFTSKSGVFLTSVPEPAPLAAFGLGVLALASRMRRKTKA